MTNKTFTLDNIQGLRKQGLYFLYKDDVLVYIGVSRNVYTRILEHCFEDVKDFDSIKSFIIESNVSYSGFEIMEVFLINNLTPKYNKLIVEDTFKYYCTIPTSHTNSNWNDYNSALAYSKTLAKQVEMIGYEK